jgi:AcrR family transcriptional regulator
MRRHSRERGWDSPPSQRSRILDAVVAVVAEHGLAGSSIARVLPRARVSRRTFLAHFNGIDAALASVADEAFEDVSVIVRRAFKGHDHWRDSLRASLAQVLLFFDQRPELARVLLVETLTGHPALLRHRRAVINRFCAVVVERISGDSDRSPLVAESALAAVMGVAYSRLIEPNGPLLIELVGPLMAVLTATSSGPNVATELRRGAELTGALRTLATPSVNEVAPSVENEIVPKPLRDPRAFRARACLLYIAAHPGSSNRQVGDGAGVAHRGQLCALLQELDRLGLLAKNAGRPGHANSWRPTSRGRRVAQLVLARRVAAGDPVTS